MDIRQSSMEGQFVRLAGLAMSRLHLTGPEFYRSTPIEIHYALQDWRQVEQERQMMFTAPIAETLRIGFVSLFNVQVQKKSQIKRVEQFVRFPWEKQEQKKPQTLAEMRERMISIANHFNKKK